MKSSALQLILWAFLILCVTVDTQAQTRTGKNEPAGVSGKVTIKGKAAPGITVGLRSADVGWPPATRHKGTTDREGYYRITNVAPRNLSGDARRAGVRFGFLVGLDPWATRSNSHLQHDFSC